MRKPAVKIGLTLLALGLLSAVSYHMVRLARADMYAALGAGESQAGRHPAAVELYRAAILLNPDEFSYYEAYADAILALAEAAHDRVVTPALLGEALWSYGKAAELNPREGTVWLKIANTSWWLSGFPGREKEVRRVEPSFDRALSLDPANGMFLYGLVNYYLSSGQIEESRPFVQRLAATYPSSHGYLRRKPEWPQVEENFKIGLLASADNVLVDRECLMLLSHLAAQAGDYAQAASYLETLTARFGDQADPQALINLGRHYAKMGEPDKAVAALVQGISESPEPLAAFNGLLYWFRQEQALDLYVLVAEKAAARDYYLRKNLSLIRGKAAYFQGDFEKAKAALGKAHQEQENAEALGYLARIALMEKDWDTAELAGQRATVLEPDNVIYYHLFAESLLKQGKYRDGLEPILEAIRRSRTPQAFLYNTKGWLHFGLGDLGQAIDAWKVAAYIEPQSAAYPRQIAQAYLKMNDLNTAESYLLEARQLKPEDQGINNELAKLQKMKTQAAAKVN
ncbi:MAG: tetratricopeptide repeat protein [Thermodesulfobacteriota bacterium]